jgi:hypothetical protein
MHENAHAIRNFDYECVDRDAILPRCAASGGETAARDREPSIQAIADAFTWCLNDTKMRVQHFRGV